MSDVTKELLEALKNVADWIHGLPIPTTGATAKLKRIDAAIARAEASLSSSDDAPSSAEERRLRRMLCRQRHGVSAYMDDGEATFGGDEFQRPTDYLRESLDSIEQAWIEAGLKQAVLAEPQPDADGPWKNAVIEQLVVAHILTAERVWFAGESADPVVAHILTAEHESDPLKAVQDLLAYHADAAVDPRVSGAAAKLVEQAKAEEREACAHEGWMAASWDCEDRVKAAILARGQK